MAPRSCKTIGGVQLYNHMSALELTMNRESAVDQVESPGGGIRAKSTQRKYLSRRSVAEPARYLLLSSSDSLSLHLLLNSSS